METQWPDEALCCRVWRRVRMDTHLCRARQGSNLGHASEARLHESKDESRARLDGPDGSSGLVATPPLCGVRVLLFGLSSCCCGLRSMDSGRGESRVLAVGTAILVSGMVTLRRGCRIVGVSAPAACRRWGWFRASRLEFRNCLSHHDDQDGNVAERPRHVKTMSGAMQTLQRES